LKKVLPTCQEVSRLLSSGLDERLPVADRARLRLHLVMCQACRNVGEQMQFIRQAMKRLGEGGADSAEPPPKA
jgi:predicted anti-sigma-YlaC factor YlaD